MPYICTALSPRCIPVVMYANNYTCFFALAPEFAGGYAFVDPEHGATMSLEAILTEQRAHNSEAISYLQVNYPEYLV